MDPMSTLSMASVFLIFLCDSTDGAGWAPAYCWQMFYSCFSWVGWSKWICPPWNEQFAPEHRFSQKGNDRLPGASIFRCELLVLGRVVEKLCYHAVFHTWNPLMTFIFEGFSPPKTRPKCQSRAKAPSKGSRYGPRSLRRFFLPCLMGI